MTPKEFSDRMTDLSDDDRFADCENIHGMMDDLMCEVLSELGYSDGVSVFEKQRKWYA